MRKSSTCILVLFVTILVASVPITFSRAADYTKAGVKPGDWAKYSYLRTDVEVGETVLVKVVNVTAPTLFLNVTYYKPDGSYDPAMTGTDSVFKVNVSRSSGMSPLVLYVIAAGLKEGDPCIYDPHYSLIEYMIITDTVSHMAAGASRTCNYLHRPGGGYIAQGGNLVVGDPVTADVWWDQATGILVSLLFAIPSVAGGWTNITMTSTNIWTQGLVPWGIVGAMVTVILVAVAIIAAAVILQRR